MEQSKTCTKCGQIKKLNDFYKSKKYRYSACKKCHNQSTMDWRKRNKESFSAYKKQWQKDNPDKIFLYVSKYRSDKPDLVKKWRSEWGEKNTHKSREYRFSKKTIKSQVKSSLVTASDIKKLLNLPCLYCGSKSEHVDHIFPLSRGGSHSLGNLAPACAKCNLSKSTKTVMEWRLWKMRLGLSG